MAVCSQIHTKHINTLCGQNVELMDVQPRGTYSDHWALKFKTWQFQPQPVAICHPHRSTKPTRALNIKFRGRTAPACHLSA